MTLQGISGFFILLLFLSFVRNPFISTSFLYFRQYIEYLLRSFYVLHPSTPHTTQNILFYFFCNIMKKQPNIIYLYPADFSVYSIPYSFNSCSQNTLSSVALCKSSRRFSFNNLAVSTDIRSIPRSRPSCLPSALPSALPFSTPSS